MLGFVDVSHMSDGEVKRLGHMDDPNPPRRGRPARVKPQGRRWTQDTVWAAAVMAQDINGAYIKESRYQSDEAGQYDVLVQRRNRDIMMELLAAPEQITQDARDRGQACRQFLQKDLTFRALKGRLTDFDQSTSRVLAVDTEFDEFEHRLEIAVAACLPASAARAQSRQTQDSRVQFARGGFVAPVGAKVQCEIEVLSSVFSNNWNCWFIRAITDRDQPVFFSYREGHDAGTHLTVQGTVKAHKDNLTQLNRVKVL